MLLSGLSQVAVWGLAAVNGWTALQLRAALIEYAFLRSGARAASAADKWSVIFLAILWVLSIVVLSETRRKAAKQNQLLRWLGRSSGITIGVLLLVLAVRWVLV